MSSIERLLISGIRSYDTDGIIEFLTPLTLIVGENGCGKTTIIECLRYATTGELPNNSKTGGAFIHDPALEQAKETNSLVKLKFKTTAGVTMVIARKMKLIVKKTTRQQKSMEGSLAVTRSGERTAISSRVAELDQLMPQYLGVSKAVLDYVIFCHQDESLWPLSTSADLKKRFDELFEALKYTKAIDNIKLLHKKQKEDAGKLTILEEHAKNDKDRGEKLEKRIHQLSAEVEELRAQAHDFVEKITEATSKSNDAWERHAQFESVVVQLEAKRTESRHVSEQAKDLQSHMKEMAESDEQLRDIQSRYEERMELLHGECDAYKGRYNDLMQEIEARRKDVGSKQSEVGRFQANKDRHDRQLHARVDLIRETASRHEIRGFDLEVSDENVRDFMARIGAMARDQNRAFEKARQEAQEEVQQAQKTLNELNNKKSVLNQSKMNAKASMSTNDGKIATLQVQLDKIDIDEGAKAALESALEDANRRLAKAKTDSDKADWDAQIRQSDSELRSLDDEKERLDTELILDTAQASETARLDLLRKDLKDRERSLDTMSGAHGEKIARVVGGDWSPATLERSYNDVLSQHSRLVREAELQQEGVNRELGQLDFKLKTARKELDRKRRTLDENAQAVQGVLQSGEASDYPEELAEAQDGFDAIRGDTSGQVILANWFERSKTVCDEKGKCQLCLTDLSGAAKTKFQARLDSLIQKTMQRVTEEEVNELRDKLDRIKCVQARYDTWVRLKTTEIPALEAEEKALDQQRITLVSRLEEKDQIVKKHQEEKRELDAMQKTVQQIIRYHAEIVNFNAQIADLGAKQKSQGSHRGLEAIKDDLKSIGDRSRTAKAKLSQLASERDRARTTINALELEARDVMSKLSAANFQFKEKTGLLGQMEELKSHISDQRGEVQRLDQEVQGLAPRMAQAEEMYNDARRRGDKRVNKLQQEAAQLSDSHNELKKMERDINDYIDRGGPQQLSTGKREVERLEEEIVRLEEEQRGIAKDISKRQDQLRSQDETKRAITDNLRYRDAVRRLAEVEKDIKELESRNAEDDKAHYEREGTKWNNHRTILQASQATVVGTMKTKDNQLKEYLQDYESEYAGARENYRTQHIKHEICKATQEDLKRFESALDQAIMKFHAIKMEEINRIIEELWRKTYQGTDVDTIVIRSEGDGSKSGNSRSYNYRVRMIKQEAEMDMRGRCSAGQKVLACIIIRLALAECFGVNCGLIALDEPTTNLDRANIRALAEALSEIIKARRAQSNFQLIVITHDEEFIRFMQPTDFVDSYYRVFRNDKMNSEIRKQSIAAVM